MLGNLRGRGGKLLLWLGALALLCFAAAQVVALAADADIPANLLAVAADALAFAEKLPTGATGCARSPEGRGGTSASHPRARKRERAREREGDREPARGRASNAKAC